MQPCKIKNHNVINSSTIWILNKYLVHLETYKSLHDEYDELQMLFENR